MEGVNFILWVFRTAAYVLFVLNLVLWALDGVIDRIVSHNSKGSEDDG